MIVGENSIIGKLKSTFAKGGKAPSEIKEGGQVANRVGKAGAGSETVPAKEEAITDELFTSLKRDVSDIFNHKEQLLVSNSCGGYKTCCLIPDLKSKLKILQKEIKTSLEPDRNPDTFMKEQSQVIQSLLECLKRDIVKALLKTMTKGNSDLSSGEMQVLYIFHMLTVMEKELGYVPKLCDVSDAFFKAAQGDPVPRSDSLRVGEKYSNGNEKYLNTPRREFSSEAAQKPFEECEKNVTSFQEETESAGLGFPSCKSSKNSSFERKGKTSPCNTYLLHNLSGRYDNLMNDGKPKDGDRLDAFISEKDKAEKEGGTGSPSSTSKGYFSGSDELGFLCQEESKGSPLVFQVERVSIPRIESHSQSSLREVNRPWTDIKIQDQINYCPPESFFKMKKSNSTPRSDVSALTPSNYSSARASNPSTKFSSATWIMGFEDFTSASSSSIASRFRKFKLKKGKTSELSRSERESVLTMLTPMIVRKSERVGPGRESVGSVDEPRKSDLQRESSRKRLKKNLSFPNAPCKYSFKNRSLSPEKSSPSAEIPFTSREASAHSLGNYPFSSAAKTARSSSSKLEKQFPKVTCGKEDQSYTVQPVPTSLLPAMRRRFSPIEIERKKERGVADEIPKVSPRQGSPTKRDGETQVSCSRLDLSDSFLEFPRKGSASKDAAVSCDRLAERASRPPKETSTQTDFDRGKGLHLCTETIITIPSEEDFRYCELAPLCEVSWKECARQLMNNS